MMRKIRKFHYEKIKNLNAYKKYLGHNLHLCTLYGVASNKKHPLWKRVLSHVYYISIFEVVDDCPNPLSEEEKKKLHERILEDPCTTK